jgi:hypothetical protein
MLKLMPPQNQAPYNPPSPVQTRYDFIMNPEKPKRKLSLNLLRGKSLGKRILIIAAGAVVLIILIVGLSSLFGGSGNTPEYIAVAQDQNELIRVANEATGHAAVQNTNNLAESVQLSITSAQEQLLTYLGGNGHKVNSKELTATKDIKTDQELTAAEAASNYDVVFAQVMQSGLQGYIQDIKTVYPSAGPKGKSMLINDYNGAKLLLSQANTLSSTLQAQ